MDTGRRRGFPWDSQSQAPLHGRGRNPADPFCGFQKEGCALPVIKDEKKFLIFTFRERGRGGERETSICTHPTGIEPAT